MSLNRHIVSTYRRKTVQQTYKSNQGTKRLHVHGLLMLMLIIIVATQAYVLFFNWYSEGTQEKSKWYEKLPLSMRALIENGTFENEKMTDFIYDDNSIELVIGLANGQEAKTEDLQKNGEIQSWITFEDQKQSVVVKLRLEKVSSFLSDISKRSWIKYVEPNWKFHADTKPNDPEWEKQWGLKKIEADLAWNTTIGTKSILVAVVDTGIDYTHTDLAPNYVPLGHDWVNDDEYPMDDNGHGTHCAGIISAAINNAEGMTGIAQVGIMAEKALNSEGWGSGGDLAKAIIHAVNKGAKIISCSWGSGYDSSLIYDAAKYAYERGVLIVAAAGNSASDEKHYPAAYVDVIAVTATGNNDSPASFTTYGDWVDIAAPGAKIYSTYLKNQYKYLSGTSMACPHVAGVAALILSEFPTMTVDQVTSQLLYTADDLGADGFDVYYGYGRVNARKAVEKTLSMVGSIVFDAPTDKVYFVYVEPTKTSSPEAAYDAVTAGMIYGLVKKPQQQGFITKKDWLLSNGKVNSSTIQNSVVVFVGGPCAQSSVDYYENANLTLVKFYSNATHYGFVDRTGKIVDALSSESVSLGHEDMFVIEVLQDDGNAVLIVYGFCWKGTWAGGVYFKDVLSVGLNDFSGGCYVFRWVDEGELDGVPQNSEINLVSVIS